MHIPSIQPEKEVEKITTFLKTTFSQQGIKNVVLGVSGGIDSATSLYLLKKILPLENIYVLHLPYVKKDLDALELFNSLAVSDQNKQIISIKPAVDSLAETLQVTEKDTLRFANIMVRMRMITLFDFAKKIHGLVIGTENKSEHLLGYYTRFGDEASDVEPLRHLYKTHVYEVAKVLQVPNDIISKKPTAGLWNNQTDENEFGFSYKEADVVLYLYFEQKKSLQEITSHGFENAEKIITYAQKNAFKHQTPYVL